MRSQINARRLVGVLLSLGVVQSAAGQTMQRPARVDTPAEDAFTLYNIYPFYPSVGWWKVATVIQSPHTSRALRDSALELQAASEIAQWKDRPVAGLQLDPLGQMAVTAGDAARAKQAFAERLSTSGLSSRDQAYTLLTAVQAFSHTPSDTTGMRTALEYLQRLDGLPANTLQQQFAGHTSIADAYYFVGQGTQVATHLGKALSLVARMSFEERVQVPFLSAFIRWADVVAATPRGRTQIDSMVAWLRPYAQGAPDQMDNAEYRRMASGIADEFVRMVKATGYLGQPAPPITAQFWLNTAAPTTGSSAAPGAQVKALDDGVIRILEIGHFGCPGCLMALPMMERLRQTMPKNVEVWFASDEGTYWGAMRTTPTQKVQFLSDFYNKRGYRFPIAIFIGANDVADPDFGTVPQENPTKFPLDGWPWFVVTDGRGIVRHIGFNDDEEVLRRTVEYLIAEAAPK